MTGRFACSTTHHRGQIVFVWQAGMIFGRRNPDSPRTAGVCSCARVPVCVRDRVFVCARARVCVCVCGLMCAGRLMSNCAQVRLLDSLLGALITGWLFDEHGIYTPAVRFME